MCDDKGPSKVSKFHIDDVMINLRKSSETLGSEECEKIDLHEVPKKFILQGSEVRNHLIKSRSDSDLYRSDNYKNLSKSKDFEVSSFPSDSDITVIRVLKRSRVQGTPSKTIEGILGDGHHLPESQSMINLVELVQGIPEVSFIQECLIPVSSWDNSSTNHRTESDTKLHQSAIQLAAACSWIDGHRFSLQLPVARAYSSSTFVDDRFFPKNVVAGLTDLLDIKNKSLRSNHTNNRRLNNDQELNISKSLIEEIIIPNTLDLDDKIFELGKEESSKDTASRSEKFFDRFFTRIQKSFRRALRCSCFFGTRSAAPRNIEDK